MPSILLVSACAFGLSLLATEVCKRVAIRIGIVSRPRGDRWNARPVPLLGGVAMAMTLCALAPLFVAGSLQLWAFLAAALTLFAVGLADDVLELRPATKLAVEILVACLLAAVGLQLRLTHVPALDIVLTIVWITGVTNAVNLLDNMDGLAAGVALIAGVFRLGFFVLDGNMDGAMLAGIFTGTVLGFLMHNFAPASIFMGDAGSLFLGFCLSGLSLVGGYPYSRSLMSVLLLPVLLLLVPLFDTTFVTITRTLAGRPVSVGGRDHTSHRLVALGLTPRTAVLWLYSLAVISGLVGVFTYRSGLSYAIVLIAFLGLSILVLGVYLSRIRVYPEPAGASGRERGALWFVGFVAQRHRLAALPVDAMLIAVAYYTAHLLRFEDGLGQHLGRMTASLPIVAAGQLLGLLLFRVHLGMWRYFGLYDLMAVVAGVATGTAGALVAIVVAFRFSGFSRTLFVIDALLLVALVTGGRLLMRAFTELLRPRDRGRIRVLIYGAGAGGRVASRELLSNVELGRTAVGFLDDDVRKQGRTVNGLPVLGGVAQLDGILAADGIGEVVIASHSIGPGNLRELRRVCGERGVALVEAALRFTPVSAASASEGPRAGLPASEVRAGDLDGDEAIR